MSEITRSEEIEESLPPKVAAISTKTADGGPRKTTFEVTDDKFNEKLARAFGTDDENTAVVLLTQLQFPFANDSAPDGINMSLAVLHDIRPKDQLEAMLAVQMVANHHLAMHYVGAATRADREDSVDRHLNRAMKLQRLFSSHLEALNRHRGKGQQKVTVEHVTVNQGGQAIVGQVSPGTGGSR